MLEIRNPATSEILSNLVEDTQSTIEQNYKRLVEGQKSWKLNSLKNRLACILKFSELLEKNRDSLALLLTQEVGKPLQESKNEVNGAIKRISFFLKESENVLAEKEVNVDGQTREIMSFDPLGVIVNISAWNYPYLVGVNVFIPALIAGNGVLYKPSEFATLTGLQIEKLLHEAGIPHHVFKTIVGKGAVGEALLNLPINGVFFTGSYNTGKKIAEKVRGKMIPLAMELGGKDPLYVRADIKNIESVASNVAEGHFYNNGQSCCAVERIYVHEKIYSEFVVAIKKATLALKVGDPLNPQNTQGSLTRPVHLLFLKEQIDDALKKGAKLLCGGEKIEGPGAFFMPTLLTEVDHSMSVMKDETFGPVCGIMKVKSDEEAILLMNDCEYGLTAAVYSEDTNKAREILNQVNAGTSYINCCDRVSAYLPWAGRKNSGLGVSLSSLGLLAFVHPRGIHLRA